MEKIKCKKQASKFKFLNNVTDNQHRKGTRIHLSASWSLLRYAKCAMKVAQMHCTLSSTHSAAKQQNSWMWLLTLLAVSSSTNTGQKYLKKYRAFANTIKQETGLLCNVVTGVFSGLSASIWRTYLGLSYFFCASECWTIICQNLIRENPMPIVNLLDLTMDV